MRASGSGSQRSRTPLGRGSTSRAADDDSDDSYIIKKGQKRGRVRKLNPAVPLRFEDVQSRKGKESVGWIDFNGKRMRLESADEDDEDKSNMVTRKVAAVENSDQCC
ncbi:hypothetical protein FA95DRAFT_1613673 [Auriscalpium vulgare]|uniref:Uncharacterized protein n=1 Tax=Auriscalpium vulgare TaxID=40419 RepID=A0ACB8R2F6_9AGAM|nr:hypothetical protein FA95DRAFT_1613673 [Auriscalpium vulgare]